MLFHQLFFQRKNARKPIYAATLNEVPEMFD